MRLVCVSLVCRVQRSWRAVHRTKACHAANKSPRGTAYDVRGVPFTELKRMSSS